MNRLQSLSTSLAAALSGAAAVKQRAASIAACRFAVANVRLAHPSVDEALEGLRQGRSVSSQARVAIQELVARLDDRYLTAQDTAGSDGGGALESLAAFVTARAAAAVFFASGDGPDAAADCVYEAAMAVGDERAEFFACVEKTLS